MKPFAPTPPRNATPLTWLFAVCLSLAAVGHAIAATASTPSQAPTADITATTKSSPKDIGNQIREALGTRNLSNKQYTVTSAAAGGPAAAPLGAPAHTSRQYIQARAAALSGHRPATAAADTAAPAAPAGTAHWDYAGDHGPQAWGQLQPGFSLCATGKRQSPIDIEEGATLQGPAEPIQFDYSPSQGTVVNNGHTIQVDVQGDNAIQVRNARYRLVQFHFHSPSEETINQQRYAMVAHLVHQNDAGQLAVVAVLLEPGEESPLINKVWTYMPLDTGDRVRMPEKLLNLNELLPADQRYYQFMGSLTTPPCSEDVLWMVLKQPVSVSAEQFKLFSQLYPHNARPVQPLNGRAVRSAQ